MKSYRFAGWLMTGVAFFVLCAALVLNQTVINPLFNTTYILRENVLAYDLILSESKLPLGVLNNVSTQFKASISSSSGKSSAFEENPDRKARLAKAYSENLDLLIQNNEKIRQNILILSSHFRTLESIPFVTTTNEFIKMHNYLELIGNNLAICNDNFRKITPSDPILNEPILMSIDSQYESMQMHTRGMLNTMTTWNAFIVESYMKVVSMIYIFLLAVSLVLVLFLTRILSGSLRFIMIGMKQINRFDPDMSKLPHFIPTFSEEKTLVTYVRNIFDEQKLLNELKEISNQYFVLDDILDLVFEKIRDVIPMNRLGIAFIDFEQQKAVAEYAICDYEKRFLTAGYEAPLRDSRLGRMTEDMLPYYDNDITKDLVQRPLSSSLNLVAKEGILSNMVIPLISDNEVFGYLFFSSKNKDVYEDNHLQLGESIAHELASIISKTYLTKKMLAMVTETFARLVEEKDFETGDHINRMTAYAALIATQLIGHENPDYCVKPSFVQDLKNNAPIHDIGKVGIPDAILKKEGKLTPEEFEIMKTHSVVGGNVLASMQEKLKHFKVDFFQMAYDITIHHHEKWDGSGYPDGLRGMEIPLAARIVAIADVFDALVSKRVYKEPMRFETAISIIKDNAGVHFDPLLVDIFLKHQFNVYQIFSHSHPDH